MQQLELQASVLSDGGHTASRTDVEDFRFQLCLTGHRVTDTLPKHWGGAGSAAIPAQLEAKATSHAVLVSTLQQAGVLARLPASACRQGPHSLA